MCDCDYFHLCIYSQCDIIVFVITNNLLLERNVLILGKLIKKIATENNISEEIVEKSIEKIITSSMNRFANDKYTLWKSVFGEERPSAEEFLEKMDDLVIKN